MPAYNFQARFAEAVASGEKRQTIRAIGKRRHAFPGEHLQLYTGMRTKHCRKLITPDPVCLSVGLVGIAIPGSATIELNHRPFLDDEAFARADGFSSMHEMLAFFFETHGLPFAGYLIKW